MDTIKRFFGAVMLGVAVWMLGRAQQYVLLSPARLVVLLAYAALTRSHATVR